MISHRAAQEAPSERQYGLPVHGRPDLKVLHIAQWLPHSALPLEGLFVQRHIAAAAPYCGDRTWHIDVRPAKHWRKLKGGGHAERTLLFQTRISKWYVIEWMATVLILWAWLTRDRSQRVDLINFHIAYPNCTRIRLLRIIMRRPMVITEHFSAYRIGFNSKSRGVDRIRRIFHADVPVIVVSQALGRDITTFAGPPEPQLHMVDNAVDLRLFHPYERPAPKKGVFFAIAGWRSPKRPDLLIDALAGMVADGFDAHLRIAGDGPYMEGMKKRIADHGLSARVTLLGPLMPEQAAIEFRAAHAMLHASDYETYCAVCAEALCCGTPVIASGVGGIPEFVTEELGALVRENTVEAWVNAWMAAWDSAWTADRQAISVRMGRRASFESVGKRYSAILHEVAGHKA
ncbi:MAG: glycosyltransferase [Flavobacteriales bacterium]|nr:glycosyltransferase [Flavobacteriales bacterium]